MKLETDENCTFLVLILIIGCVIAVCFVAMVIGGTMVRLERARLEANPPPATTNPQR